MRPLISLFSLVLLAISLSSCKKQCFSRVRTNFDSVMVSDTVKNGSFYNVKYKFTYNNGCGKNPLITVQNKGNLYIYKLETEYEGCTCTLALRQEEAKITSSTSGVGKYYFEFQQTDGTVLKDSMEVVP